MTLDFAALADGIVRNNVGVGAIQVSTWGSFDGDQFVVRGTNQRFTAEDVPVGSSGEQWHTFSVETWDPGEPSILAWIRATDTPGVPSIDTSTP